MRRTLLAATIASIVMATPAVAFAARAYALSGAQIFSGPGSDYPVVAQLGSGLPVNVNGCVADYSWCDVSFGPNRGWVYAGDLGYPYRNRRVPIIEYGSTLSLPIITFSLGNYWDRYYRGRPFYAERNHWEQRWHEGDHGRGDYRRDHRDDRRADDHREYRGTRDAGSDHRGDADRREVHAAQDRGRGNQQRAEQARGSRETSSRGRENGNESGM